MPGNHAKLSPSAAARWISCPGSVKLSQFFPQGSTIYADEGTLAHACLEWMIKHGLPAALNDEALETRIHDFYEENPQLTGSAGAMLENVYTMTDWIADEIAGEKRKDPSAQLYSEQQVDLSDYIPGGFGTADVTIARTGFLHIIDLKYGKGVPVYAQDNPQLRLYALGMLEMLDLIYDVKTVRMTIFQPRLENISTDEISTEELRTWGETVVRPAAELALSDDAPFSAGAWCQFCPARKTCRTRAKYNTELDAFFREHTLSDQELGLVLGHAEELGRWVADLKDAAQEKIMEGGVVPGWKLVEGRSVRKFTGTEEQIVKAAAAAGYEKPMLYETRMITLSAMEKLMGKKNFSKAMHGLVEKPQGKPTLAPESDKRPSIMGADAKDVFADEIENE